MGELESPTGAAIHDTSWLSCIGVLEEDVQRSGWNPRGTVSLERRSLNVGMCVPVRFALVGDANGSGPGAGAFECARNGIRLKLRAGVRIGSDVLLEMEMTKGAGPSQIRGRVVWARPSANDPTTQEVGVAFENLHEMTRKERFIEFMADKICHFALLRTQGLTYRPAASLEEMRSVFRLLYKEYKIRGYCEANPAQMHYGVSALFPQSCAFVLKREERLLGTVGLVVDSPCGLPMETLFPEEVARLRGPGRRLAEVGLLALDQDLIERRSFSLISLYKEACLFRLFKTMFDYARAAAGVTDLIIGMHPKHADLYRYLTFEPIGPVRSYPGACGKPALPMRMDIPRTEAAVPKDRGKGEYFLRLLTPSASLHRQFVWSEDTVRPFLFVEKPLWKELPQRTQEYLLGCYPKLLETGSSQAAA